MTKWEVWGGGCEVGVEGGKVRRSDTFGLLFVHCFSMATSYIFQPKAFLTVVRYTSENLHDYCLCILEVILPLPKIGRLRLPV